METIWEKLSTMQDLTKELEKRLVEKQVTVNLVREDSDRWRDMFIEAKGRLSALLTATDAVELAKVKHTKALTEAWTYHWSGN